MKRPLTCMPTPKFSWSGTLTMIRVLTLAMLVMAGGCGRQTVEPPTHLLSLGLSQSEVKTRLLSQYVTWQGVPYRNGGQSRRGLDCSAFVQLTYQQKFGLKLPRTTEQQANLGGLITNSGLRPGDLIFFKTGWNDRHIGIYLEKYRFIHVSTTVGVTISKMTDPYWYERYWQARRVFN
ncbi:MAG: C40 family peptidase [Desulfofustis sp.]|nr:C40 family peptidase [Desulfofustis sp.]